MTASLTLWQPASVEVPDFVEPVEAWRAWRVGMCEGRVVLQSRCAPTIWVPGVPVVATCRKQQRLRWRSWRFESTDPEAPDIDCTCGIYGVRSVAASRWYLERRGFAHRGGRVIGRVALWGDVVEGELGWRASRAYPIELFVPAPTTLQGGIRRRAYVDEIVTVSDAELRRAMALLAARARLVVEPSGAATMAAHLGGHAPQTASDARRVIVLSGGNVDPALFAGILAAEGEPANGR